MLHFMHEISQLRIPKWRQVCKPTIEMGSWDYKFLNRRSRDWKFNPGIAITSEEYVALAVAVGTENVQVVELPIVDSVHPRPPFIPQSVPADLAPRIMRLHGHPFVWWVSQFVSYLFRLQPQLRDDIEQLKLKLGFRHPIVGSVCWRCWLQTHILTLKS